MNTSLLASFAMLFLVIGTVPSILSLVKDRKGLSGFNTIGVLSILIGQLLYTIYFLLLQDYMTTLLTIPLVGYWGLVLIFLVKNKDKKG